MVHEEHDWFERATTFFLALSVILHLISPTSDNYTFLWMYYCSTHSAIIIQSTVSSVSLVYERTKVYGKQCTVHYLLHNRDACIRWKEKLLQGPWPEVHSARVTSSKTSRNTFPLCTSGTLIQAIKFFFIILRKGPSSIR